MILLSFKILYATMEDIDLLVRHRVSMWNDISAELTAAAPNFEEKNRGWIKKKLSEGKLIGFIAKTQDGHVAGSGCLWIREHPPIPMSAHMEVPYLLSMYTEEGFRRKGVGKMIVEAAIAWCRDRGYDRINLDASEAGKRLYETLGFKPGYSMRLQL